MRNAAGSEDLTGFDLEKAGTQICGGHYTIVQCAKSELGWDGSVMFCNGRAAGPDGAGPFGPRFGPGLNCHCKHCLCIPFPV